MTLSVAMVHHHLRGGGVTQIIRQQCVLLGRAGIAVTVFSGEEGPDDFPAEVVCVPGLGYASDTTPGKRDVNHTPDSAANTSLKQPAPRLSDAAEKSGSAHFGGRELTAHNDPQTLLSRLDDAAERAMGGRPAVWHIHNHALGKNPVVTAMVAMMAEQGRKLLLHIHDFAEDNRPHNYRGIQQSGLRISNRPLHELCYPTGPHVHYAVLNGRDYANLKGAGFPAAQLQLLPNPVENPAADAAGAKSGADSGLKPGPGPHPVPGAGQHSDPQPGTGTHEAASTARSAMVQAAGAGATAAPTRSTSLPEHLILYPVRVIPRKNIGEMVLWSAISQLQSPGKTLWAATLPPKNPAYREHYSRWTTFCADHRLPVLFEAGVHLGRSFPELVQTATCVFTSSMAEGFGMVYLEPWLAGKPLAGRLLPDITRDFSDSGVQFPGMYTRAMVPLHWLDTERLGRKLESAINKLLRDYGFSRQDAAAATSRWMQTLFTGDTIDFGVLDDDSQREVITYVLTHPETVKNTPLPIPWLEEPEGPTRTEKDRIDGESVGIRIVEPSHEIVKEGADFSGVNRSDKVHPAADIIASNRSVVLQAYSPDTHLQKIQELYRAVVLAPVQEVHYISGADLLGQFLKPEQFTLQRVSV
ncbi:MAG: hypothetical protein HLUCCA01_11540 [Bacteroidetes bacterium HLUCCA01]|nr:MAG: hypothetical protein HLUCCA01_11540 [Bacteroidetes bacterium HLUCCA01]